MIEINLLPGEMVPADYPPPARIGTWAVGLLLLAAGVFFIIYYKMVKIPDEKTQIATQTKDIEGLNKRKAALNIITGRMTVIDSKIKILNNLLADRIIYARLFDRLCDAVNRVPNTWFKAFTIAPDASTGEGPGPHGKRYKITLNGFASGNTEDEMSMKLRDLIKVMNYTFRERESDVPDSKTHFNTFLGATFETVDNPSRTIGTPPAPTDFKDPRQKEKLVLPAQALDFLMTMKFELAPKQK